MEALGFGSNDQSPLLAKCVLLGSKILLFSALSSAAAILIPGDKSLVGASQPPVVIKMVDMPPMFEPTQVTINAGESVEWQNVGNEMHHATSDPSLAIKSTEVANPSGTAPFDSGFLRPGETFTHTFSKRGVYKYACVVHEVKGMIGAIVVK